MKWIYSSCFNLNAVDDDNMALAYKTVGSKEW